ncbi:beta-glucan synthesis-associated [Amylostereum chailletii]|nr:beta-glucan synthesis-associated [Amylostereum chailletii]
MAPAFAPLPRREPSAHDSNASLIRSSYARSLSRYSSLTSYTSPYPEKAGYSSGSLEDKYALPPDPSRWGANVSPDVREADDDMHNPDVRSHRTNRDPFVLSSRGLANIGCLAFLCIGILTLFAGYPIISYFTRRQQETFGAFNLGGTNASGQVPDISGKFGLIDPETPREAYTKSAFTGSDSMELVFSDEFNTDGRTFYPGDDPYWEAVDLHYWQTNNLEWYDPAAITTKDGALTITLTQKQTHGLDYQGGMMSSWNKFCFTGGYVETSVILPGTTNIHGLWPAVWAMGNLGRAGYGASLHGMWPYTYDACDVGTVANQTLNGLPEASTINGDKSVGGVLSYLPGQRLSRCTCPGESHPGPVHKDGSYVGRAAPEIDLFEAQIDVPASAPAGSTTQAGEVSQSAQWAPFDAGYVWNNNSDNFILTDPTVSKLNTYLGGNTQQATSVVSDTDQQAYELTGKVYSIYGFEYRPGFDNAYITWITNNKAAWTIKAAGVGANAAAEISARPIPQEPLYLIMNLGMSKNFGVVQFDELTFPTSMYVDYIRVYQRAGEKNVGCDPDDFPTAKYIEQYPEAYANPNFTTWDDDFGQTFPKNRFLGQC